MFGIANRIAYEDRMDFGMESRTSEEDRAPHLGESCWIHLPGAVQGRLAVSQQIEFVAACLLVFICSLATFLSFTSSPLSRK